MTFTSLSFLICVSLLWLMHLVVPSKCRWAFLLVASYGFYASFKVPYLLLALLAATLVSYGCALRIESGKDARSKLFWMWTGILGNLSLLFWLKYLPFVTCNLNAALDFLSGGIRFPSVQQLLALGVSYYVFQGISYLIDVYLEAVEPERHLGYFSLSMSFFPKLLQGPIERSGNLLPQLRNLSPSSLAMLHSGFNLFLLGVCKKVVIADRLATFIDPVYGHVHNYYGISLVVATYLFALQLYFDFSGYTDMALGLARCFNIRLTPNFNAPYLATSTADFWRRWHISFSSWILDYIFKPLQFSLRDWARLGVPVSLLLTFLVSGLWHGASWCFVAWGGLHGFYLAVGVLSKKPRARLCKRVGLDKTRVLTYWQRFVTFHLVCFSWIFFRAATVKDALYVAYSSVADLPRSFALLQSGERDFLQHVALGRSVSELLFALAAVVTVSTLGYLGTGAKRKDTKSDELAFLQRIPFWGGAIAYGAVLYLITICGVSAKGFIYQQF